MQEKQCGAGVVPREAVGLAGPSDSCSNAVMGGGEGDVGTERCPQQLFFPPPQLC